MPSRIIIFGGGVYYHTMLFEFERGIEATVIDRLRFLPIDSRHHTGIYKHFVAINGMILLCLVIFLAGCLAVSFVGMAYRNDIILDTNRIYGMITLRSSTFRINPGNP